MPNRNSSTLLNRQSAILYQNPSQTVVLIDIPLSIALAQLLPESLHNGMSGEVDLALPRSSPPLQNPYPGPPEPRSEAARSRVLERIPASELRFQDLVAPIITCALQEIRQNHGKEWCLPRRSLSDFTDEERGSSSSGCRSSRTTNQTRGVGENFTRKRKRIEDSQKSPNIRVVQSPSPVVPLCRLDQEPVLILHGGS